MNLNLSKLHQLQHKLKRGRDRLYNWFVPGNVILLYHRIADSDSDPWGLAVSPQNFAEQLAVLQELACPLPLPTLYDQMHAGDRLQYGVAVTFDDGYADNLYAAKPALEKYGVPATVFVASGYVDAEHEFWWDELEQLILHPGALPTVLSFEIQSHPYTWNLGASSEYSPTEFQRYTHWRAFDQHPPTPRHQLYLDLWKLCGNLNPPVQRQFLNQLWIWADRTPVCRATHRSMTRSEVVTLDQGSVVTVGVHTVSHPFLSRLSADAQREEIQVSKTALEGLLKRPIQSFAYPFGDHNADSIAEVAAAGFKLACSTVPQSLRSHHPPYSLPRIEVKNWSGAEFAHRLTQGFRI